MSLAELLAKSFAAGRPSTPPCSLKAQSLAGAGPKPAEVGGIPWEHLVQIGRLSTTHGAILIRDVNPTASPLILRGYATKPLSQKGKSADWGPQAGFIPANAYYAKKVANQTEAMPGNLDLDHALEAKANQVDPETEPPVRLEGRVAVNVSVPLVLGEWRMLEVLRDYLPTGSQPRDLDDVMTILASNPGHLNIRPVQVAVGVERPIIGYRLSGGWAPPGQAKDSLGEPKTQSTFYLIIRDELPSFLKEATSVGDLTSFASSVSRQASWVFNNELPQVPKGSPRRLFAVFVSPSELTAPNPNDHRTMKGANGELTWLQPKFGDWLRLGDPPRPRSASVARTPSRPASAAPASPSARPPSRLDPMQPVVQPMRVLARPGKWDESEPKVAGIPYTADYDLFAVCPSLPVASATGPAPADPLSGGLDPEEGKLLLASIAYLSASWMRGATLNPASEALWATHKKMIDAILGADAARQFRRALSLTHTRKVLDQSLYGSFPNSVRDAAIAINGVTGVGGGKRTFKVVHHGAEQHNLQVTQDVTGEVVAVVPNLLPNLGAVAGDGPFVYFTKDATELSKLIRALRKAGYYYKQNLIHLVSSREKVKFDPFCFVEKLGTERELMTRGSPTEQAEWAKVEETWTGLRNIVQTYETSVRGTDADRGCLTYLVDQIGAKDAEFKIQARNIIEGIEFCALISEQPLQPAPPPTRPPSGSMGTRPASGASLRELPPVRDPRRPGPTP